MFGDYTEFESALKAETIGQFGFNPNNNSWHGGVHFTHNNAAHLKDDMPVVAIADGKVVACRINDKYQTSTFKGETLTYSHDFCLIQHDVVNPDNSSERFTFYSLYMHLAPLGYPHRQVTQRPQKKVFKKYQAYSEPNVDGETFALLPGSIVESQSDTLEHHGDHYFQSYRIARADDLALQDKTIWLVTQQDTTPPDVSHQFLEQTLFTPNTYNTASVECLGLKRELRIRYSPSMDAPYFSLRQNSKVKLLNDEPVRDGDFILKAYEIVYNSNASVKEVRQGDKVWMPVAKYAEKQAINQEGMEAYSPPDWVLTKVVAKTIREGLAGRAEPYLKNGVLQAGNVAYRIPEGTVLGYKRSENCNVQMINGKSHLMALCRVSSDSPVINASGQKMTSAWVCVEDEFVEKQTVYSLDLGKTHCFGNSSSLHVKAGEAIGYLGRYDAATIGEEPPYTTRHQIHFELFSTEKPPQFFIDLFFGVSEEQPEITFIEDTSNCDGYFDRDEPSGFFQQFNDDPQEGGDPVTSILKRLKPWDGGKSIIAKHENEWSLASSEKPFFDKLVQKYQDPDFAELIEHEKTRLDDLIWLPDVGSLGITKDTWNWWPIHGVNVVNDDVDDVYLVTIDKPMSIEDFAKQTYNSDSDGVIKHILKTNPHLKRSFHQIVAGMPMVVSPHKFTHSEEKQALTMADELMSEFLTLDKTQQEWYGENSALINHVSLMLSAESNQDEQSHSSISFDENHALALATGGIAGYQIANNAFNDRFNHFSKVLADLNEELKNVPKSQVKSHPAYKKYRIALKSLEVDTKGLITKFGNPAYFKKMQVKKINNLLNIGNRQLFRTSDFNQTYKAISESKVFNKAMSISKHADILGNSAFLLGARSNIADIWGRCDTNSLTEDCARALVKNGTSMFFNYQVGAAIARLSMSLVPISGGVSLVVGIGGNVWWGYNGGAYTDAIGEKTEYVIFDVVIDGIKDGFDSLAELI